MEIDNSLVGLHYELAHVYAFNENFEECLKTLKYAITLSSDVLPAIDQDSIFEKFRESEFYRELQG
ncbi:MAG: TPR end-of-group domain-containing protein [Candidatus Hodarchaeales archaeon]